MEAHRSFTLDMEAKRMEWVGIKGRDWGRARKQKLPCEQDTKRAKDCLVSVPSPFCAVHLRKWTSWGEDEVKFQAAPTLLCCGLQWLSVPGTESFTAQAQTAPINPELVCAPHLRSQVSGTFSPAGCQYFLEESGLSHLPRHQQLQHSDQCGSKGFKSGTLRAPATGNQLKSECPLIHFSSSNSQFW